MSPYVDDDGEDDSDDGRGSVSRRRSVGKEYVSRVGGGTMRLESDDDVVAVVVAVVVPVV